eukprot:CFRG2778T1
MRTYNTFVLLGLTSVSVLVHGLRIYQTQIPNGANVPCPPDTDGCENDICPGVGHDTCVGGTFPNNQFGLDFQSADHIWTVDLCNMDSDGDGATNGQELGDPCCEWVMGEIPEYADAEYLGHPGFATSIPAILTACNATANSTVNVLNCTDMDGSVILVNGTDIVNGTYIVNNTVILDEDQVKNCTDVVEDTDDEDMDDANEGDFVFCSAIIPPCPLTCPDDCNIIQQTNFECAKAVCDE